MELRKNLENSLYEAMRKRDERRKNTIRMVISAIKSSDIDHGGQIDDTAIIALLHKEIKIRNEIVTELSTTPRLDLVKSAKDDIEILEEFLPTQLSDDQIIRIVNKVRSETGANSLSDFGRVMKICLLEINGQASSERVSNIVKDVLSTTK